MKDLRRYRMLSNDHLEIQNNDGEYEEFYSRQYSIDNNIKLDLNRSWKIKGRKYFKPLVSTYTEEVLD